ncbi:MAG: peptidyl-prolyl cis-trans isomerase [Candidatus Omnitrophica bacterium]|nr:peptidyl-prolyl cis-trans isomerase [Candidatus Omnitrophota bacterium]
MDYFYRRILIGGLVCITAATVSGCDLFSTGKKTAKKPSSDATSTIVTTPSSNETADSQGSLPANVLARVGNWTLTLEEFNQRLKLLKQGFPDFNENDPQAKAAVLNELIRQQLLVKDAENSDIADKKDIKDAVEDFRRTLLVRELANRITKDLKVTEEEAQKYYDQNKDKDPVLMEPLRWKVREIVVDDEAAAKNILVQLLQGADFAETAKAQSKGKTASQGGALPEFTKAPFEAMQKAIASVDAGGTSGVFKAPDGFYIVRVEEKKGGSPKVFGGIKGDLIIGLTQLKQQSVLLEYIDKLAQKTKVEINRQLWGAVDHKGP